MFTENYDPYTFEVTIGSIYTIRVHYVSSHNWLLIHHGSGIHRSEVRSGLHEVEFVVVNVSRISHILTKYASPMETKSSQFCRFW